MNGITREEWRDEKEAERRQLADRQQAALTKALSNGENLAQYLAGRGRLGSRYSSGNSALILDQNPRARVVKSLEEWGSLGRRVGRGEHGIQIIGRERGYWRVLRVFELAQTYGARPCKIPRLSANEPEELETALDALGAFSPVQLAAVEQMEVPARYDPQAGVIQISAAAAPEELFGALAAEIVKAHVTMTEETAEPSPVAELYGQCAAVELCGRFGLDIPQDVAQRLESLRIHFAKDEERAMLDEIREYARSIGNGIEKEMFPPERGRVPMEMIARSER